ncbi:MAG: hypothetical protein AAF657_30305 [Acidobacteriota bacterium]
MLAFPHLTAYVNQVFGKEKTRLDYILLRPLLLISYFFLRLIVFPLKYFVHRRPYGFEARCIDASMAFGLKYLASHEAAELLVRHVQIEPLLYRHLLSQPTSEASRKLNGIDGDFNVGSLKDIVHHNMTIGHDELSYEIIERFDKEKFLGDLQGIRRRRPDDHGELSKQVLAVNKDHSWQLLGCTNVVIFIVMAITIFGDLRTTIKALNSFDSDSIVLWCLKHIFVEDPEVMIDLDFYMQVYANRSHYDSGAFFSDPSQYLYYHIAFDEFAYHILRNRLRDRSADAA